MMPTRYRWLLVPLALLLGLLLEYKLGLVDQVQDYRHQPARLPSLPLKEAPTHHLQTAQNFATIPDKPATDWAGWRAEVRRNINQRLGDPLLIDQDRISYEVLSEKLVGEVKQQLIVYTSFDGQQIPAYLSFPARANSAPALVIVPGHVREGESGIEQLASDTDSYQHAAALRLAEAGFVTLAFELRGFGYLGLPGYAEHKLVAYNALLGGRSYKELILKDTAAATALLKGLSQVASDRIGITGASLGGEIAVQYAALDENISAVAFHSYGGQTGVKKFASRDSAKQPHYCHIIPGIDRAVRQEHWFWLLAPRPVLGVRGKDNQIGFIAQLETYSLGWGEDSKIELKVEPGGHEFFVEPTITFFEENL